MTPRTLVALAALAASGCITVPQSAYEGHVISVTDYLGAGHSAGERFDDGDCPRCTLLHYAALGGSVDVMKLLVSKGADVNALSGAATTPLHYACLAQRRDAVGFLLANGANLSLSVRDVAGNTPLLHAVAATRVREQTVIVPAPTGYAAAFGSDRAAEPDPAIVALLLDAGAYIGSATNQGNTPLHIAAYRGFARTVRLLLFRGADPTKRNARGETPDQLADRFGKTEIARVLREAAAAPR